MINFRFHLASLVAVFLALTIGIVVGATVGNQAIVNSLKNQIDRVQKNTDTQRDLNRRLSSTNDNQQQYLQGMAPYVVEGRLTAVPVVVIAEQGVDRGRVRNLVTLFQDAGAQTPAIVWLQSKWLLRDTDDRSQLAAILGDSATSSQLRVDGFDALAQRLGHGVPLPTTAGSATTTTTTAATPHGDVLAELTSAGFLKVEAVGAGGSADLSTFPTPGPRVVVLGGTDSDLAANPTIEPLSVAFADVQVPTVAGELYAVANSGPARGTTLSSIVGNHRLDHAVSTVDDLDLVQGRVTAVLAIEVAGRAQFGHYGYGKGADRALPSWTGP